MSSPFKGFYLFFCGLCMGTADLIPGISGGTIAFIMGFYHALLEGLKTINSSTLVLLFTLKWKAFFQQVAWKFLLTLVSGIACAILLLSSLLHEVLSHEVYRVYLYSCFLGLILASFVFCLRQIKTWSPILKLGLVSGAVAAYFLTSSGLIKDSEGHYAVSIDLNSFSSSVSNYHPQSGRLTHLSASDLSVLLAKKTILPNSIVYDESGREIGHAQQLAVSYSSSFFDGWLIVCGAVAVCALLLPGISGSYLLTLLGVYPVVIAALAELMSGLKQFTLDWAALSVLSSLLIGIVIGAICFARSVSALLRNYPDQALAVLSGFMIGALRSVWPFWSYTYALSPLKLEKGPQLVLLSPIWPSFFSFAFIGALLCSIAGFGLVFLVEYLAKKKAERLACQA